MRFQGGMDEGYATEFGIWMRGSACCEIFSFVDVL